MVRKSEKDRIEVVDAIRRDGPSNIYMIRAHPDNSLRAVLETVLPGIRSAIQLHVMRSIRIHVGGLVGSRI